MIDFTDVGCLASRGMSVLPWACDAAPPGIRFGVDGPMTLPPMTLIGFTEIMAVYASRGEALDALAACPAAMMPLQEGADRISKPPTRSSPHHTYRWGWRSHNTSARRQARRAGTIALA
jgi:hypothetical protein